jgi:DNA-binding IscR family transcriptional regulator
MSMADEYLLGDAPMHNKFQMTAEILERFVAEGSSAVTATRIAECTGRTTREVMQICKSLQRAAILQPVARAARTWTLARDPSTITLEDVYRCVAAERSQPQKLEAVEHGLANSVDLLIMQATIAINQSLFQHLRQFSLDRPDSKSSGMFSARSRSFRPAF